jgi:hypothetical protein
VGSVLQVSNLSMRTLTNTAEHGRAKRNKDQPMRLSENKVQLKVYSLYFKRS